MRPRYFDVVPGSDNIPLLSMSGHEEEHIGGEGIGSGSSNPISRDGETLSEGNAGAKKDDEARARIEDLSSSVPAGTLPGGKTFNELPLYEKKSVLIDRELE